MSGAKPTIIVVDDDADMNQALERLLNAAGFEPTMFRSGEALLADGAATTADCFILDVHLPGISGFELQERIALCGAVAPVIFITAYADSAARERAREAGAAGFFSKPFSGQPLLAAIQQALVLPQ